jgi:helicase MOV-10
MPSRKYNICPPTLCTAFQAGKECDNPRCKASHFLRPCDPCQRLFYSDRGYRLHIDSERHRRGEAKAPFRPKKNKRATELCSVCQTYVNVGDIAKHEKGNGHTRRVRFHQLQDLLKAAQKDKKGVFLEGEFDFGVVALKEMGSGLERRGTVRTMSSDINVTLLEATLGSSTEGESSYVLIHCFNVKAL